MVIFPCIMVIQPVNMLFVSVLKAVVRRTKEQPSWTWEVYLVIGTPSVAASRNWQWKIATEMVKWIPIRMPMLLNSLKLKGTASSKRRSRNHNFFSDLFL